MLHGICGVYGRSARALTKSWATSVVLAVTALTLSIPALAQSLDEPSGAIELNEGEESQTPPARRGTGQPRVGRRAAEKYMGQNADPSAGSRASFALSGQDTHYLAVHLGSFISDKAFKWGLPDPASDIGSLNAGVTYRVGEWVNSMDLAIRIDFSGYDLSEGRANKLSFLPVVTFPDASAKFPLYFGAGAGLGIFVNQIGNESSLAFDYQVFGGARFFEVFGTTGFFLEAGLKNHLHLLSDGQFNGTFAAIGTVFTF